MTAAITSDGGEGVSGASLDTSIDAEPRQFHRASTRSASEANDSITVLKSTNGSACKRITAQAQGDPIIEGYTAGAWFFAYEEPAYDIVSLSSKLKVLETLRNCLVIRGAPRADLDCSQRQRRQKINFQTRAGGWHWVLIDFDKIHLPPGLSLQQDIEAVCAYLISLLPPEFHHVSYHWQLSSSAGIGDPALVSMHLWFWLDRPVTDAQLKAWSAYWNAKAGMKLVDPALFNDVQAHYTAAPMFVGMEDPFPVRSGLVRKQVGEVALKLPPQQAVLRVHKVRSNTVGMQPSGGFEGFLRQIGDHPGGQGFHKPIIRAIASYVGTHGRDGTDLEALYGIVRTRILATVRSQHDDAYVEETASRAKIVRIIEQAIAKYGKPNARRKSRQMVGVQPHFISKPLGAAESSSALRNVVKGFFGQRR